MSTNRPWPPLQTMLRSRRFIAASLTAVAAITSLYLYKRHRYMVELCSLHYPQMRSLYSQTLRLERDYSDLDFSSIDTTPSEDRQIARTLGRLPELAEELESDVSTIKRSCADKGYFQP